MSSDPAYDDLLAQNKKLAEDLEKMTLSRNTLFKGRLEEVPKTLVKSVDVNINPFDMYDERKFLPQRLVEEIIGQIPKYYLVTPISEKGGDIIFRYHEDKGIYGSDGIPWTENLVKNIFGELVSPGKIGQVLKLMQISTYRFDNEAFEENPDHVVVLNGTLNIYTRELKPFSPDYQALSRIPVEYDKEAKCPKILRFLKEVTPNSISFIQEWVGYHLLKDYRFQKALMLIGTGANGKTTFLKLLEAFLGKENVSHESLYQLNSNRFSPAELYGKLANIAPDISEDELKRTGYFKALTGGDSIRGERKHQNAFYFFSHAKLNFSCNKLPTTPDMSYAFFRRWMPLVFSNIFEGENDDPNILEKITTPEELSGFLNWVLDGLDRILETGRFSKTPSAMEIQELWEEMQDPVNAFVKNCLIADTEGRVTKDDLYLAYTNFCRTFGHVALSKTTLTTKFKPLIPGIVDARPKFNNGKRKTCWVGINIFCGLLRESCQACQGCQGSPFLDNERRQLNLKQRYRDLDDLDDLDTTSLKNVKGVNPSLKVALEKVLNSLRKAQKIAEDVVKEEDFIKFMKAQGWTDSYLKKILGTLELDEEIFRPRPGYLKCTKGA